MSTRIKYTEAEKKSFRLCPEACPKVEAAFEHAQRADLTIAAERLRKEGIEPTPVLLRAVSDIVSSHVFQALYDLRNVVIFQATMPLRLALVERIEQEMREQGEVPAPNHFRHWIADRQRMDAYRASRA